MYVYALNDWHKLFVKYALNLVKPYEKLLGASRTSSFWNQWVGTTNYKQPPEIQLMILSDSWHHV